MAKKFKKIDYNQAREEFRILLVKYSKCSIQGGMIKGKKSEGGWPCGTCTVHLLTSLGLDLNDDYRAHNKPVDRTNEVWRAILQIRDAKIK